MTNATQLLEIYSELSAKLDAHRLSTDQRRAEILAPMQEQLAALEIESAQAMAEIQESINACAGLIQTAVLESGESAKGGRFQAVWSKGRVAWDTKKLDGMAAIIPQINEARKVGEPSVSIKPSAKS